MKFGRTYYRLLDSDFRAVAAVYRIDYAPDSLTIQRYDPEREAWTEGPATFLRFVNEGEDGADEITKTEADVLIARGLPALPILEGG